LYKVIHPGQIQGQNALRTNCFQELESKIVRKAMPQPVVWLKSVHSKVAGM